MYDIPGKGPVSSAVEVFESQRVFQSRLDSGRGRGDFARHVIQPASGTFVVEWDCGCRRIFRSVPGRLQPCFGPHFRRAYALRGRRGSARSGVTVRPWRTPRCWTPDRSASGPDSVRIAPTLDNGKPIDSGRGNYIVEKLGARCARRQVIEMMRAVSLDQCADRFAVRKVQSMHLDFFAAPLGLVLCSSRCEVPMT